MAGSLAFFSQPIMAADEDGDGIADNVETSVGLDPAVANVSFPIPLTPSGDFNRHAIDAVQDADGNYHLSFARSEVDTDWDSGTNSYVMYMMVDPDGNVLIDEYEVATTTNHVRDTKIQVDSAGLAVIVYTYKSVNNMRIARVDPSLAAQDGTSPAADSIDELDDALVDSSDAWKKLDFEILDNGDYLFIGTEGMRTLRTTSSGGVVFAAGDRDSNWDKNGHGYHHGFMLDGYYWMAAQYCGNSDEPMEDCVPAFAAIDPETMEYAIAPTPMQVDGFRKAHGSHMEIGHDDDGNVHYVWTDKRGSYDTQYCDVCYSQTTAWYGRVDAADLKYDGLDQSNRTEMLLGGRGYPLAMVDGDGNTHVTYWDAFGFDYQVVSPAGEASAVVTYSDTAIKANSWKKDANIALAGDAFFIGEIDPEVMDGTDTYYGVRYSMQKIDSSSLGGGAASATSSAGRIAFFENVAGADMPGAASVPDTFELGDSNYRMVITGLDDGQSVTVTIDTGEALPDDWRAQKYNGSEWISLAGTAVGSTSFAFEITDGGEGDADGAANGMIVDPVALGTYIAPADDGLPVVASGGGGGCTIGGEGPMDPTFPMMLVLAAAWLMRRKLKATFFTFAALSMLAFPAQAADTDGDGINDDVEIAIGTDPDVPNGGTIHLTSMQDANRFRPHAVEDADGNFHLVFIRFNKYTYIRSADYTQVVYMMLSSDGQVLIDETVVNDDPVTDNSANNSEVLVEADGRIALVWTEDYDLHFARLDPSAHAQDGSSGDMTDTDFAVVTETETETVTSWYITKSHVAADGDIITVNHHDGEMYRYSVDDTGAVTATWGPLTPFTNVDEDGHTLNQAAFDADDNIHFVFVDDGSYTPATDNNPLSYGMVDGSDGSVLTDATPMQTIDVDVDTASHGVQGSIDIGSDGMLHVVWGDKRGTLDENEYCTFCGSQGTAWYAKLDPSALPTDGSLADMSTAKVAGDVRLGTRWYIGAFLGNDDNMHVMFNEQGTLDHIMVDTDGNIVSSVTQLSAASINPNDDYKTGGQNYAVGDTVFFLDADPTVQAGGQGISMRRMSQTATAGSSSGSVSSGVLAFLEEVTDGNLPDSDDLPSDVATTGMNYRLVISGVATGGASSVTIDTGSALPDNMRVFKHNGSSWEEFQWVAVGDTGFRITLVDGGAGDADGEANGLIVDPIALTTTADIETTTASGDGGGCTIGKGPFDPLFPLMLILGAAYLLRRRLGGRSLRVMALALAGSLAIAPAAQAEDEGDDYLADSKTFFTSNTYVGIQLGSTGSDASTGDIANLPSVVTVNNIDIDDGGTGYRIFFGKQVHDHVAVEIGFVDLGEIDITADVGATDPDTFLQELAANAPVAPTGFTLDALASWTFADFGAEGDWGKDLSLRGRLGLFFWNTDVEFGAYQGSETGQDLHFGLGAAYSINEDFDVIFEWESYQSTTTMDMIGLGVSYSF